MATEPELATLLVSCPDRRGIVAALSQVLYGHGANILDSDQHTDTEAQLFFQRIRFDLSELLSDRMTLERAITGSVNDRHAAPPELLEDLVIGVEHRPDERCFLIRTG